MFFLATDYVGSDDVFWQERLGYLLGKMAGRNDGAARGLLAEFGLTEKMLSRGQIIQAVRTKKHAGTEEIGALIARAASLAGESDTRAAVDRFMGWDAVRALQAAGQYTESHGCSHTPMTRLSDEALGLELAASADRIEKETGRRPRTMAYPNGDYDGRVEEEVREAGYALGFTTVPAPVSAATDPMRVPRVNLDERGTRTEALFLCRLAGIF